MVIGTYLINASYTELLYFEIKLLIIYSIFL